MRVDERKITSEVALCGADGRLSPAAVGWTRRLLHDHVAGAVFFLPGWVPLLHKFAEGDVQCATPSRLCRD